MDSLKRLILNAEKEVSWAKLGIWLVTISGALLSQHLLPSSWDCWLKLIIAVGGAISGIGIRDAFDDTVPKAPEDKK